MAIAQMNWGKMRYDQDDLRMKEFIDSLPHVYADAERRPGFIWRIPDEEGAKQLKSLGFGDRTSATVSVWRDVSSLRDYTFNKSHGIYFDRRAEWFEKVDGPQLVIWEVDSDARPDFAKAFKKLKELEENGPTDRVFGWPQSNQVK